MDRLLESIAELFETAADPGRERIVPPPRAPSSSAYAPGLLFSADTEGRLTAIDILNSEVGLDAAAVLAADLAAALRGVRACVLASPRAVPGCLAVAVRRPGPTGDSILGCALRGAATDGAPLDETAAMQLAAGAYAWAAAHWKAAHTRLRTRIEHLQSEQDTLRASHAEAIAAAIDEREERLRQQQELVGRLQAVMMMAADGILIMDEQGTIDSFNAAASTVFGYSPDEVIGRDVAMLMVDAHSGRPDEAARERLAAGTPGAMCEMAGRRKNGDTFPLEWAVSEVCLSDRPIYTVIFRDIGERRMLEAQLRHAQKLESIGQLAAGIAHEINTPTQYISDNTRFLDDAFRDLSNLMTQCGALREVVGSGGDAAAAVAAVVAAAAQADTGYLLEEIPRAVQQSLEGLGRVAKIVRSMKEFSHPGGEDMQAVDLNRAIESTLTVSHNEWKYVADVVTEFDPQLPMVECLPGEINQVVLNLIVNAAHAIADKVRNLAGQRGTITVRTRRDGDWVEISVADTGTGIPVAIQGRVFDPFFTTKEVGRGTGQGLAIAHSVVTDKHGGTIRFESQPGEGTTFLLRLPVRPPAPRTRDA